MTKTTKFKVILEVEVTYDVPEGVASTPYTSFGIYQNKETGSLELITGAGKIISAEVKKADRLPEPKKTVKDVVENYFEENNIEDLMQYGSSSDARFGAFGDISDVYYDILEELGYPVEGSYAEDATGDGKYNVYLTISGNNFTIPTKAWRDAEGVFQDIKELIDDMEEEKEVKKI
jgi:hypothetical protein